MAIKMTHSWTVAEHEALHNLAKTLDPKPPGRIARLLDSLRKKVTAFLGG